MDKEDYFIGIIKTIENWKEDIKIKEKEREKALAEERYRDFDTLGWIIEGMKMYLDKIEEHTIF